MKTNVGPATVITGDIVRSGRLSEAVFSSVMTALKIASGEIASWPEAGEVIYERFRGDGWQLYLPCAAYALRAACVMRAAVHAVGGESETRLAIGIGPADRAESLGASGGPAFERSGQALEALGTHRLWGFGGCIGASSADRLADGLIAMCDERTTMWTARQAEIAGVLLAPSPPRMTALADAESVQPQTVQTHFDRAGGHALREAITAFETVLTE